MGIFDNFIKKDKTDGNAEAITESLLTLTDVVAPSAINIGPRNINISGT